MSEDTTTIEEMKALARRAVGCLSHWRWMPGMFTESGAVCVLAATPGSGGRQLWAWPDGEIELVGNVLSLPDLGHPATLGCLLALVREAWDDPFASAMADGHAKWRMVGSKDYAGLYDYAGLGYAEALVCALEAAP